MGATPEPTSLTRYTVLEWVDDDDAGRSTWKEVGAATSTTRKHAIDTVVGNRRGTFKAVATRYWKGATRRTVETVEQTSDEEVDL